MSPRIHAPALPTDVPWLNVERPLAPEELRGRVVLLHFWTYACINCLHTLPVLAALERQTAGGAVVVIGVHSAKLPTEADPERVRDAVRRHGVRHPVVVDIGGEVWSRYAVKAWPTLVVVGPDGVIAATSSGEPELAALRAAVEAVLAGHPGTDLAALPVRADASPPAGPLAFPGGLAVEDGGRVWVADTGHHQLVALGTGGAPHRRVGSGRPGLRDGTAEEAAFREPHGLVVDGGRLLVADTGNHAVREVDLRTGAVTTLAGTGRRGGDAEAGRARSTDLRSPWDVAAHPDGGVLVAMAGSHQLWGVQDGITAPVAGSGREARVDGDAATAAFAQPSGLAWGPAVAGEPALYVADSESSAIRRFLAGEVRTVAGGDLFTYGDVDGRGDDARFQHPVGICAAPDGRLLVADTLNSKVRVVDPGSGVVSTLDGIPCREPEAVAVAGGRVVVADTGHHRVLAVAPGGDVRVLLG